MTFNFIYISIYMFLYDVVHTNLVILCIVLARSACVKILLFTQNIRNIYSS